MATTYNNTPILDLTSATWYAWGRNDAEGTTTDVFAFADYYVSQRPLRGQSIQDAYTTFTTGFGVVVAASIEDPATIAPIADEVRDFLAKAIDEAQS
jgi:hypothetical protein